MSWLWPLGLLLALAYLYRRSGAPPSGASLAFLWSWCPRCQAIGPARSAEDRDIHHDCGGCGFRYQVEPLP